MQPLFRLTLLSCLLLALAVPTWAAPKAKEVEYHRDDMNFYWKGDVLKAEPGAVILPMAGVTQKGDSYLLTPHKKAPKHIYIEVVNDWIEPITPPNATAPLAIAPDEMQIREPQGDVEVALPSAPATFVPVAPNMVVPNGSVIKTGPDSTAAVLFGGVNSARLIPNSEAAVQQTVAPQLRTTEVDLTKGAVFSKVGQIVGVKQDYKVHTPLAVAAARGTDFVSIALPKRTDVWIAQGTVQLDQTNGKLVGTVQSEGTGGLKIVRYPPMTDAHASMMASSETMTAAMDIIPVINLKMRGLHDRIAKGETLTPQETAYMARIKKVPCLIKLALVEPPAPAPPTPAVPVPEAAPLPPPPPAAAPSTAPADATPATPPPAAAPNAAPADATPAAAAPSSPATPPSPSPADAAPAATSPPPPSPAPSAAPSDASPTPAPTTPAPSAPPAETPSTPSVTTPPAAASDTPSPSAAPAPSSEMPTIKANPTMTPRVEESTAPTTNAAPTP